MERIKRELQEGENVIWEYRHKNNLLTIPLMGYFLGIAIIGIISVFLIYDILIQKSIRLTLIVLYFIFAIGAIFSFFISSFSIFRKKKITRLKLKDLKRYEDIYVLTNQRYIQKSYDENRHVKESRYSTEQLVKHDDIVFVNLNSINSLIIDNDGISELRMDYLETLFSKGYKASWLGLEFTASVPEEEFMEQLFKLIPFKRVKEDEYGTYYHRK